MDGCAGSWVTVCLVAEICPGHEIHSTPVRGALDDGFAPAVTATSAEPRTGVPAEGEFTVIQSLSLLTLQEHAAPVWTLNSTEL